MYKFNGKHKKKEKDNLSHNFHMQKDGLNMNGIMMNAL